MWPLLHILNLNVHCIAMFGRDRICDLPVHAACLVHPIGLVSVLVKTILLMLRIAFPSVAFTCYVSVALPVMSSPWCSTVALPVSSSLWCTQFQFGLEFSMVFLICTVRCVVIIVTEIQAGLLRNFGLIPNRGKIFFSSGNHPEWVWGPPILLFSGYQGPFPCR